MTLPIVAGLALAGAGVGIQLGKAAISEINPAHFSEPQTRFHADLVPYRSSAWAQAQVAEEVAAGESLGTGCIKCRAYPAEYYPVPDPAIAALDREAAASIHYAAVVQESEPAAEAAPNPEWQRVERYASYPVSSEEEAAQSGQAGSGESEPAAE